MIIALVTPVVSFPVSVIPVIVTYRITPGVPIPVIVFEFPNSLAPLVQLFSQNPAFLAGQQIILIELPGQPVNFPLVPPEFPQLPAVQRT
jgi:hypothetical protein